MQRFYTIILSLLLLCFRGWAINPEPTEPFNNQALSFDLYWGYLQYHHPEMAALKQSPAQAIKVSYILNTSGNKLWQSVYRYPAVGVSYMFMYLGHDDALGYAHIVSPFIAVPVVRQTKRFSSDFYAGTGIGFMPKVYHPIHNSLNTAISTHLNIFIDLGLRISYQLTSNLRLNGGAHIAHFSNGSIKKPNYGLNYTLLSVGLQYGSHGTERSSNGQYNFDTETNRLLVLIAGAQKEATGFNGPKFGVTTSSIEYSHPIGSPLFRIGTSLDFMYDGSNKLILEENNITFGSNWELAKLGVAVNAEIILDRLSLILHFGGYYHNLSRNIKDQWVYQRVGLRYQLTPRLWAHLALKTHWNLADYIELGIAVNVLPSRAGS